MYTEQAVKVLKSTLPMHRHHLEIRESLQLIHLPHQPCFIHYLPVFVSATPALRKSALQNPLGLPLLSGAFSHMIHESHDP